jgi:hypothetical protein
MKNLVNKIKRLFNPLYSVVYTTKSGRTALYTIEKPQHSNEFGNAKECLHTAGFKAYCYNRGGVRSFRYDRIVALNRA